MQSADICDVFASLNIEKQAYLWLPLNVPKLEVFQLQGGFALLTPNQGLCRLHIATLILFHYLLIWCTISDICALWLLFR